jgi:hypothetical protein
MGLTATWNEYPFSGPRDDNGEYCGPHDWLGELPSEERCVEEDLAVENAFHEDEDAGDAAPALREQCDAGDAAPALREQCDAGDAAPALRER